jgi:S-DNA-T family DNA segregation ATPase FtsK/SpoIIIE
MNTDEQVAQVEAQIQKLQMELAVAQKRAFSLFQYGKKQTQQIESYFNALLIKNQNAILERYVNQLPQNVVGWNDTERWNTWDSSKAGEEPLIRIGDMVEQGASPIAIPAFAPFIGANKTIIIRSSGANVAQGLALLQSLVIRTAFMLPHQSKYTLLDPAGSGIAFPMRRYLPQVRETSSDIRRDLDQVQADIQHIIATYLDAVTTSFELIPRDIRINERFQFVFAADFPNQYDRRAIEALQSIGNSGPAGGVYLFIHQNLNYEVPRDMSMSDFKNAFYIDLTTPTSLMPDINFQSDSAPSPQVQSKIFEALRQSKPPERILDWESIVGLPESDWWKEKTSQCVETPIGLRGGGESLKVWFGVKNEQPCAHGMLGAMTGSGKSNLYHALICGLAVRYSPQELRLYLIDGKDGVEFQHYRRLPHAEVVSLRSSSELSLSVLAELILEKERRNTLFRSSNVADFMAYRKEGQPKGNLPRILLLVDEYQELFEGDRDGIASGYLLQLAQQGRSAGIHVLLASQRFGAAGMLHQTAIFGNIHLRMAMHMTDTDVQALSEFNRRGKALITTCDLPGKIVVNDGSGDDSANQVGKVAYLQADRRDKLLQKLVERMSSLSGVNLPGTIVFDGQAQANLLENAQIIPPLQQLTWLSAQQMEVYARKTSQEGGLEIADWFAAEQPRIAWLGQEFSVRGQAKAILRRRSDENMLIVGSANAARYGMLASTLVSLCISGNPANTEFKIVDRSIPGTRWNDALQFVYETAIAPAGFKATFMTDEAAIEPLFDELLGILAQRQQSGEELLLHYPSVFVMMTELDRVARLRRVPDAYGLTTSPSGEKLRLLLSLGPALGIHFILSFSGVRPLANVMDERSFLPHFRHRVALQMSEDESFTFVRSRKAAQLQLDGPVPISALYLNLEHEQATRFKPYSTERGQERQQAAVTEHIQAIGAVLAKKGTFQ